MPARDPETGQFTTDAKGGVVDYSDFVYEHFNVLSVFSDATGGGAATVEWTQDPLESIGGLEPQQVAEIVAIYVSISATTGEPLQTTSALLPIQGQYNAYHGVNLEEAELPTQRPVENVGELVTNVSGWDDDAADSTFELRSIVEPAIFWSANGFVHNAVNDDAGGWAHSAQGTIPAVTREFRQMVGRGPVIEADDTLDWWLQLEIGNANTEPRIEIDQVTVYDLAEISDARVEFSIP